MSDNQGALDVLQDPLLTLLALIIFGTLPVIIPGTFSPPDRMSFRELEAELRNQRGVLQEAEEKLQGWRRERRKKEFSSASQSENDEKEARVAVEREIDTLLIRIDELRERYRLRENYRNELKRELVARRIESEKRRVRTDSNRQVLESLQGEITEERRKLAVLDERIEQLSAKDRQGGVSGYETVRPKTLVNFEADGRKIYQVNKNNYEPLLVGSQQDYILARNIFAVGCNTDELYQPAGCDFQSSLLRVRSRETTVIFFVVREDSYDVFLAARVIAEGLGFAVGWIPLAKKDLIMSSAEPSGGLPTVRVRHLK
ncbi:hypothetical protein [Candidatus Thiosymbion oneisti]|uniref:hypothetical protein n=1 Tax=Candidatus Thiosymbion oneisti TaxID=589554 RepID=UPI00105FA4C4|nr:hypothetical protein [Candidatus Thiosymbion oneisti]